LLVTAKKQKQNILRTARTFCKDRQAFSSSEEMSYFSCLHSSEGIPSIQFHAYLKHNFCVFRQLQQLCELARFKKIIGK